MKRSSHARSGYRSAMRSSGFSLIEVMVAVFVLSIGLLGMAALMATSLRNTQSAEYRSQAVNLAYDQMEMLRANINNVQAFERDYTNPAAHCAGVETPFAYGSGQQFTQDRNYWGRKLCRTLPNGSGRVIVGGSINTGYQVTIEVCWTDNRAAADPTAACPNIPDGQPGVCSGTGDGAVCAIRITSEV